MRNWGETAFIELKMRVPKVTTHQRELMTTNEEIVQLWKPGITDRMTVSHDSDSARSGPPGFHVGFGVSE